jgi:hypothetical protein
MDLFEVGLIDEERWLGYPRGPEFYRLWPDRYNALGIRRKRLTRLVDDLDSMGLIDHRKGFRAVDDFSQGRLSRMRATGVLRQLFAEYALQPYMSELSDYEEVIVLRAAKKADQRRGDEVDYDDDKETDRMRAVVRELNKKLESVFIDLYVPDSMIGQLNDELGRKPENKPFEPRRKRLRRIFNNGTFNQGGRFYGGFWQELPNRGQYEWRRSIFIDNERTTEIDYSGLHLAMLYATERKEMPSEDPYQLGNYDESVRSFLKVALNTMLNADNEHEAIGAIRADARDYPEIPNSEAEVRELIEAFRDKHKEIDKYFYKGFGVRLQYIDSRIAERVMVKLAELGIMALPVHDSFIVRAKWELTLARVMLGAFEETMGELGIVKFSNPEKHLDIFQGAKKIYGEDDNSVDGYRLRAQQYVEDMQQDDFERYTRPWGLPGDISKPSNGMPSDLI